MAGTDTAEAFDFSAYGDEIAGLAVRSLAGAAGAAGIRTAMARVTERAEAVLAARQNAGERELTACVPGCSACCRVNVTVLLPEAIAIAAYLDEIERGAELAALKMRIADTASRVRWMDDDERIRAGVPCPFLDGRGWCTIHPVRPLTCRALSSTDPEQCRRALASHGSDEEATIVVNIFQKFLLEETFRALAAGLEQAGQDTTGRELSRSVTRCLLEPSLPDDFLAGKRIRFPEL